MKTQVKIIALQSKYLQKQIELPLDNKLFENQAKLDKEYQEELTAILSK